MLTRYVGMIGLFISITFGLSKNSLIDIKNSNNNLSLLPLDKDDLTGYLQFKKDSLSTKISGPVIMELNADSDVDLVRKDYVFISNCDSCLLALKMYKFAFDNGMSFSSDIFDPIKTY